MHKPRTKSFLDTEPLLPFHGLHDVALMKQSWSGAASMEALTSTNSYGSTKNAASGDK